MGWDLIDLAFRLERRFGVRISRAQLSAMAARHHPPDISVGELFEVVREHAVRPGVFDREHDAEMLWPLYQREISDGLGIDVKDVTKDKWFIQELGGG